MRTHLPPPPKGGIAPNFRPMPIVAKKGGGVCPIFGSFLLWPNGWMHQDASAQATMSQMGTQLPPQKKQMGAQLPIFGPRLLWPKRWMDQDATWYEGRPPGDIVLDGDPVRPPRGHSPPNFRLMSIGAKRLYASGYHLARR